MKVKIKKKEETKQYNVINSWADVTLEKWVQIIKVKDGLNSEQAKETIKALSDIPEKLIKELSIIDVAIILKNIYELQAKEDTELKRIIEIDDVEYGFHPKLDDITLGEYADLETFIKNGLENHLPEIMAILFRPVQEKKNNKYTIEAYDGDLTIRAEIMNKMSAEQVQNALVFFLDFRKGVLDDFAIIFNGTGTEDSQDATSNDFANKWGWFGVMYRLTNGEIVNLERITELGLLECLTWLSYETDLNISKSVNLNSSNGSI